MSQLGTAQDLAEFKSLWLAGGGNFDHVVFDSADNQYKASGLVSAGVEKLVILNNAWIFFLGGKKTERVNNPNAVPAGYVVLKISDVRDVISNASDAMCDEAVSTVFSETGIPSTWYDHYHVAEKNIIDAIGAREQK